MNVNPITRLDYPDPDVIRVEDTYYMRSQSFKPKVYTNGQRDWLPV